MANGGSKDTAKIVVLGDYIQDILVSEENQRPIIWEKGNYPTNLSVRTGGEAIWKPGGARYAFEITKELCGGVKDIEVIGGYQFEKVTEDNPSGWVSLPQEIAPRMIWECGRRREQIDDRRGDPEKKCWRAVNRVAWSPVDLDPERDLEIDSGHFLPATADENGKFTLTKIPKTKILVLVDYNRNLRRLPEWSKAGKKLGGITLPPTNSHGINTIVMLNNDLPKGILNPASSRHDEPMWDDYLCRQSSKEKESTLVITSINSLRRAGAVISRRKSWDRTVDDFVMEMNRQPYLRKLTEFGHLVIRIGVTAAIYCRNIKGDRKIEFTYDPAAKGVVFRELTEQGSMFATRGLYVACLTRAIAAHDTVNGNLENSDHDPGDDQPEDWIRKGIEDAILLTQELYPIGFGKEWQEVAAFPYIPREENFKNIYTEAWDRLSKKRIDKTTEILHRVSVPGGRAVATWNILLSTWRCTDLDGLRSLTGDFEIDDSGKISIYKPDKGDKPDKGELSTEEKREITARRESAISMMEKMRRLRCALQIAKFGPQSVLNQVEASTANAEIDIWHKLRCEWLLSRSPLFPVLPPDSGEPHPRWEDSVNWDWFSPKEKGQEITKEKGQEIKRIELLKELFGVADCEELKVKVLSNIEEFTKAYPFNGPINYCGKLTSVGQRDIENTNNLRSILRQHIDNPPGKPLSLAVFGSPGNGKSFAVTEIVKEIGQGTLPTYTFNLSEFDDRKPLDEAFMIIAGEVAQRKMPLVFFDEFDSSKVGRRFGWLKYFLAPMQDGTYRHPDGKINLGDAIFVFAGGVCHSFVEFRELATKVDEPANERGVGRLDPKEVKMPDFVSRLKAHMDIPGVNRLDRSESALERSYQGADDHFMPYVRRSLVLNSIMVFKKMTSTEKRKSVRKPKPKLRRYEAAQLDENLIRAMLTVSRYEHGIRSMEALLSIMSPLGQRLERASLPLLSQLNMHTNGAEFYVRTAYPHALWISDKIALFPLHGCFHEDRSAKQFVENFLSSPEVDSDKRDPIVKIEEKHLEKAIEKAIEKRKNTESNSETSVPSDVKEFRRVLNRNISECINREIVASGLLLKHNSFSHEGYYTCILANGIHLLAFWIPEDPDAGKPPIQFSCNPYGARFQIQRDASFLARKLLDAVEEIAIKEERNRGLAPKAGDE